MKGLDQLVSALRKYDESSSSALTPGGRQMDTATYEAIALASEVIRAVKEFL